MTFLLLKIELAELKIKSENPEIWKDNNAKPIFQKLKNIENKIKDFDFIKDNLEYIEDLFKIAVSENNEEYFDQLLPETTKLLDISNKSRLENLMSESADPNNIFLEIHAVQVELKVKIGQKCLQECILDGLKKKKQKYCFCRRQEVRKQA